MGRPRKTTANPNNATVQGADIVDIEPVAPVAETITEHVTHKGVKVKVKKDGVWLRDGIRAEIGDVDTIPAEAAETLKGLGFVELL